MIVNDKTLVVVGGAGRLGRAFVEACKNENAKVYVIDVCDKEKWGTMNVPCDLFVQSDINDPQSLNEAIKQLYANSKHIDCVINTSYPKNESFGEDIMGVSLENFNENVNLHLGGYFHVMQKCGYTACPSDSHQKIRSISTFVLKTKGGGGVVRELLEDIFKIDFIKILYSDEGEK